MNEMNSGKIRVEIKDWLFNAGIVGLYRILKHAEKDVKKRENYIEFDVSVFEDFERHYFAYFSAVYKKDSPWFKLDEFYNNSTFLKNPAEATEEDINEFIKRFDKDLDKASLRTAYEIIAKDKDVIKNKLKLIKDKKVPLPDKVEQIREIHSFFEEHKDIIQAKFVSYAVINNYWEGVSFLNKKQVGENMFDRYREDFVVPITRFLDSRRMKPKFRCITCNADITNADDAYKLSWMKMDIDPPRKTSKYWFHKSDIETCPLCHLVYSCVPAGFVTSKRKGLLINDNSGIERLIKINNVVVERFDEIESMENLENISYTAIINMLRQIREKHLKEEIDNIQVVKFDEKKGYSFNLLSRHMLAAVEDSEKELNELAKMKSVPLDSKDYINLYSEVIDRMYGNMNLYPLVYLMLGISLKRKWSNKAANIIFRINMNFIGGDMSDKKITVMKHLGLTLKKGYKEKDEENKIQGIAYRLLNFLKTKNTNGFLDVVINCHMHIGKEVPTLFVECIDDVERFQAYGYAFLLGLTGEEYRKNTEAETQDNN
jgi:CRISPR-associated protein Cst1